MARLNMAKSPGALLHLKLGPVSILMQLLFSVCPTTASTSLSACSVPDPLPRRSPDLEVREHYRRQVPSGLAGESSARPSSWPAVFPTAPPCAIQQYSGTRGAAGTPGSSLVRLRRAAVHPLAKAQRPSSDDGRVRRADVFECGEGRTKCDRSQVSQPINVFDLTRITYIATVRTLRKLMTQIQHGNLRAVLFNHSVNSILPSASALGAFHPDHALPQPR
jgi:hypothetical protein